jgi:hypothetical protein
MLKDIEKIVEEGKIFNLEENVVDILRVNYE